MSAADFGTLSWRNGLGRTDGRYNTVQKCMPWDNQKVYNNGRFGNKTKGSNEVSEQFEPMTSFLK